MMPKIECTDLMGRKIALPAPQSAAEVMQDFCLNEEVRLRRLAKTLDLAGLARDAQEIRALADLVVDLAKRRR